MGGIALYILKFKSLEGGWGSASHSSVLPLGNEHLVLTEQGAGSDPEPVCVFGGKQKNLLPLPGKEKFLSCSSQLNH